MKYASILAILFGASAFAETPFTVEDVVQLARANNVTSIEQLIPLLPESLRANYTFMARSSSSQPATPPAPRAILFGQDASLVLTFNASGNTIEMGQYRAGSPPSLELRELVFDGRNPPQLSQANPARCKSCHGDPVNYIWAPYKNWPGAYGESDDSAAPGTPFAAEFASFLQTKDQHPRYRHLQSRSALPTTTPPYHDHQRGSRGTTNMPNMRLSIFLARRAALINVARLQRSPHYAKYQAILASLLHFCDADPPAHVVRGVLAALRTDARGNPAAMRHLEPVLAQTPPSWEMREEIARAIIALLGSHVANFNLNPPRDDFDRETGPFLTDRTQQGSLGYLDGFSNLHALVLGAMVPALTSTARERGVPLGLTASYDEGRYAGQPQYTTGGDFARAAALLNPVPRYPDDTHCGQLYGLTESLFDLHPLPVAPPPREIASGGSH